MRRFVVAGSILTLLLATASHAEPGCYGCNIVDAGVFGPDLIGTSTYLEQGLGLYREVVVEDVNVESGQIYFLDPDGQRFWVGARSIYTEVAKDERIAITNSSALAVGAAMAICALSPEICSSSPASLPRCPSADPRCPIPAPSGPTS